MNAQEKQVEDGEETARHTWGVALYIPKSFTECFVKTNQERYMSASDNQE